MNSDFLIPAGLFLVCNVARFAYEILKEAQKIDRESKAVFALILTAMLVLWISWFSLCPADPYRFDIGELWRRCGLALFLVGTILAVAALIQLRGVEHIDHLVTSGLFRKLRHPMYTGFLLWIVGWSMFHGAVLSLGIGLVGIANVLWWRHLEEVRLQAQFGTAYQQYRITTWF
ncbi:MAG TPA: NnrU family protein [Bacteroidota bacterium]|nr:NnrU family protein [Bacteroidota bacterium]